MIEKRIVRRMEEIGYVVPTDIQREGLPVIFSGRDCILHAQVILCLFLFILVLKTKAFILNFNCFYNLACPLVRRMM